MQIDHNMLDREGENEFSHTEFELICNLQQIFKVTSVSEWHFPVEPP